MYKGKLPKMLEQHRSDIILFKDTRGTEKDGVYLETKNGKAHGKTVKECREILKLYNASYLNKIKKQQRRIYDERATF